MTPFLIYISLDNPRSVVMAGSFFMYTKRPAHSGRAFFRPKPKGLKGMI
ncbi:hypothetical protein KNP414_01510 [Paenibacillus mucilaginosus KNP414]|uniref:Uncharacterized protein n=1 Tax=Paenibacillus mucilaginosus (strain KNP414) TaxID=1036673 RepID=F8FMJ1_PAEMK|nr:hypothetical protein KNP414_01510 [Paenibacillus mucilaginosus KNP414]